MDNTDKHIVDGLVDLITKEADADFIADVLDDIYYIIAQNVAKDPDRTMGTKIDIDQNMYYLHLLRDIFANKKQVVA